MFRIKIMSQEDIEFAVQITNQMSWNLTFADFEFMIELEPNGCFVLLEDSERIGLATTINFGAVAWFGNLIINESRRRRGAGSLLVKHSIKYLIKQRAKSIGLYAYTERIPFYNRLGFEKDSEFTVLTGKGTISPVESTAKDVEKHDLQAVIEFDRSCFGAPRRKLLEPIILDPDNVCKILVEGKRLVGYAVAKVYGHMGEIGPLTCRKQREDEAINLLRAVLRELKGYEVSMYVPNKESIILDFLRRLGFAESFHVARMFRGQPVAKNCVYMAESLERG
jgi:GNAT superfamily N-acetyltransferase